MAHLATDHCACRRSGTLGDRPSPRIGDFPLAGPFRDEVDRLPRSRADRRSPRRLRLRRRSAERCRSCGNPRPGSCAGLGARPLQASEPGGGSGDKEERPSCPRCARGAALGAGTRGAGRVGPGLRAIGLRGARDGGRHHPKRAGTGGGRAQPSHSHPTDDAGGGCGRVHHQEPDLEQGRGAGGLAGGLGVGHERRAPACACRGAGGSPDAGGAQRDEAQAWAVAARQNWCRSCGRYRGTFLPRRRFLPAPGK